MYKVFLVDDEELVIKSLKASVNWNEYGFEVAGYALSSAEAFEAISSIKPDIVFTDIRMPGMSGLELIKNLKDTFSRALFIVVSGYAEFAFAQKAINYGAFGYCLKPFDDAEIIGYLKKAKVILEDRETSIATDILDFIEENNEQAREGLRKALILSGIDMESANGMKAVVSIGKDKLKLYGLRGCIALRIGFGKYAYLVQNSPENSLFFNTREAEANGTKGIGTSSVIYKVDQIKEAIHAAEINAYCYFTTGKECRLSDEAADLPEKDYSIKKLVEATRNSDMVVIYDSLDEMGALFANGQLHMKHALIAYNQILSFAHNSEEELYEDYIYSYDQLTSLFSTVQDMLLFLKGLLTEKLKTKNEWKPLHVRNRTFNAIYKYVNENYCNDISIPDISKRFNVNANYISQLFKKELGTTFTEYMAKLRIDYACQLLTTTDLPMNEIAEKAGYNDYFYFSRIFKRMMGNTPSSYRAGR
ncbi:response regulator transcription factor [Paenibacillus sedimenti]|uniref:Response regulator n=1 Tax=Paenibacillus sedimenti TaxID=2770274 RepID=A0A926KXK5_9BACL|nr:helix-turn-helix domain-containing protein [Paenibacillus sedimenti]MBD0384098.1 response regulator [Paenibacillus sedimenti]